MKSPTRPGSGLRLAPLLCAAALVLSGRAEDSTPGAPGTPAANQPALSTPRRKAESRERNEGFVDRSRTPATNALLAKPVPVVLVESAERDYRSGKLDNVNRDANRSRFTGSELPTSVERSGSATLHLRRNPGWRGVRDLFNPFAPVEKPDSPGALAFETRKEAGAAPRSFRDPATHEATTRVF